MRPCSTGWILKGRNGQLVDGNAIARCFISTDLLQWNFISWPPTTFVCFIVTNESCVASASHVLFPKRSIDDPSDNNIPQFVCLSMRVTWSKLVKDKTFKSIIVILLFSSYIFLNTFSATKNSPHFSAHNFHASTESNVEKENQNLSRSEPYLSHYFRLHLII